VANKLHEENIGTFRIDLLTRKEREKDEAERRDLLKLSGYRAFRNLRHDIGTQADRFFDAAKWLKDWLVNKEGPDGLPIGYFGASTGAGITLAMAAKSPELVSAIVSRGGRPDLVESFPKLFGQSTRLPPTLLIIGGKDSPVCSLNHEMAEQLQARISRLVTIPGATHLFEERGSIEEVARLTTDWFKRYLLSGVG
jgi:pimeloyl-ACP methyl ester carboxylesterase